MDFDIVACFEQLDLKRIDRTRRAAVVNVGVIHYKNAVRRNAGKLIADATSGRWIQVIPRAGDKVGNGTCW